MPAGGGSTTPGPAPVAPSTLDPGAGADAGGGSAVPTPAPPGPAAACVPSGTIPTDVAAVLERRCQACHGARPLPGVGGSLTTYTDFLRASESDPTLSVGRTALMRTKDMNTPMPPLPGTPLDASESATLAQWIESQLIGCPPQPSAAGPRPDGGVTGPLPDLYTRPSACSRGITWKGGGDDDGSPLMDPGQACVACHKKGEAPRFVVGGTVYATAHEPNNCYGSDGKGAAAGAVVVVVDKEGKSVTLPINAAGNFYAGTKTALVPPLRAKVVHGGRERIMIRDVPDGDCNRCHSDAGSEKALGRLILP
jgi:mono/diheme cytochrome c family protein